MTSRQERDRGFRKALAAGILVSAAAHAVVIVAGHLTVDGNAESERDHEIRLVVLPEPDPTERNEPIEVLRIRETPAVAPASAGGSGSGAALATAPEGAMPAIAPVPATLSGAIPDPIRMLEKIEEAVEEEPAVTSYASVADHLIEASPNARPFRPIDDRPVEVLAAIASRTPRGGVSAGIDPDCPPGHGGQRRW